MSRRFLLGESSAPRSVWHSSGLDDASALHTDEWIPRRVPIYSLSTLISLYSLDLAFFVDAVRDIYEVRSSVSP